MTDNRQGHSNLNSEVSDCPYKSSRFMLSYEQRKNDIKMFVKVMELKNGTLGINCAQIRMSRQ